MLSQGVPMLCAGDEISRSQGGNNNGYCQDTEISWLDWDLDEARKALLEFTTRLINFRRQHPNFHRRSYVEADPTVSSQGESIRWFRSDGAAMTDQDWNEGGWMRTIGMYLAGDAPEIRDDAGVRVTDDDFLVLLNSHHEPVDFHIPEELDSGDWTMAFDTANPEIAGDGPAVGDKVIRLEGRSVVVIRKPRE